MKPKSLKRQCFSGSGAFGSLPSPTWFIREHCIHVSITLSAFFTLQVCCAKFLGIPLSSDEAEIVETPVFQRLRGIRQLAFANLVYPGALHTRFDHTLG